MRSLCKVDSQPNHWFRCAYGTVGCPRVHDRLTPHCIACAAGVLCALHSVPVLEQPVEEFCAQNPGNDYLLKVAATDSPQPAAAGPDRSASVPTDVTD